MEKLKEILGDPRRHDDVIEFMESLMEKLDESEYCEDLYVLENGHHFTDKTLKESGVQVKYSWPDIEKYLGALHIVLPECLTPEDIVWTVNTLYETFHPLITDLQGSLKFAEKYLTDNRWPNHDRPYQEWLSQQ